MTDNDFELMRLIRKTLYEPRGNGTLPNRSWQDIFNEEFASEGPANGTADHSVAGDSDAGGKDNEPSK